MGDGSTLLMIEPAVEVGRFVRLDGHSLQKGKAVIYKVVGYNFTITATRDGVHVVGEFPLVGRAGVEALVNMIRRSVVQHEHLKSFELGTPQTSLTEGQLMAIETGQPVETSGKAN